MTLTFDCGCVYRTSGQLMWMRIKEEGNYRLTEDAIVFARPSGTDELPYRLEEGSLVVEEHPGEVETYKRIRRLACDE